MQYGEQGHLQWSVVCAGDIVFFDDRWHRVADIIVSNGTALVWVDYQRRDGEEISFQSSDTVLAICLS